jgi:hypothetical protein
MRRVLPSYAGNETVGDWLTAHENYNALQAFYKKFPQYQTNKLYLTSESYGGHCMSFLLVARMQALDRVVYSIVCICSTLYNGCVARECSLATKHRFFGSNLPELPVWWNDCEAFLLSKTCRK